MLACTSNICRATTFGDECGMATAVTRHRDGLTNGLRGASEALYPSEQDRGCLKGPDTAQCNWRQNL